MLAKNMQKSQLSNNTPDDKVNKWMKPTKVKLNLRMRVAERAR